MDQRPEFSSQLTSANFLQYYWYKQELQSFCRQYHLPTYGTKAELTQYLVQFLDGVPVALIKPVRKAQANHLTWQDLQPTTKLLDSGFTLNNEARKFFAQYFGVSQFSFKKAMAVKLRSVQLEQDHEATVQDLIDAYQTPSRTVVTAEEQTYQWNNFVKDFCQDPLTKIYQPKIKVAAILWQHVKQQPGAKKYRSELLVAFADEIKDYLKIEKS